MEAELFEPDEYLDRTGPGYFSVLAKPNGDARQKSYELSLLPDVIRSADPGVDTYITQATFKLPNRCKVNVRSVGLLFADLDTYQIDNLAKRPPEEQGNMLIGFCNCEGIPPPSIILFSGRGLQAKWLLDEALGPTSLYEWNAAQLALVKLLEPFAADIAAKDISRVLRLDQTVNTKSGKKVRVVHGVEGCLPRYAFEDLCKELVGRSQAQKPKKPKAKSRKNVISLPAEIRFKRLNWYRLYDLRSLWKLRGGVPEGYRELTLFWEINFLMSAEPGKVSDLWREAETLAAQIDPKAGWYAKSDLATLYRKAKEAKAGKTVTYNGEERSSLYTPKNQTLIEIFQITPDEERCMKTIISRQEKYRREIARRRAAGVKPRISRADKPWEAEGISRRTWYRRQKWH